MEYLIRPYRKGEEKYVAEAHRRVYSEEYRWGDSFTRYAMKLPLDFAAKEKSDNEEMWVAETCGKLVGSIMLCRTDDPSVGQARLFLLEKEYRRMGIGKALVKALLEKAGEAGYHKLVLSTASPLTGALRLYEQLGFRATAEIENRDWSLDGEILQEIEMELTIEPPGEAGIKAILEKGELLSHIVSQSTNL